MTTDEENVIISEFKDKAEKSNVVTANDIKIAFDKKRGKETGRGYIYMVSAESTNLSAVGRQKGCGRQCHAIIFVNIGMLMEQ